MLVFLLSFISVLLVLILLQLRKNFKETDNCFAALDLSMRQYLTSSTNSSTQNFNEQIAELRRQLEKIATYSEETAKSHRQDTRTIEDLHEENKPQWLPTPRIVD